MKLKLTLIAIAATVASLALVPSASAYSKYLKVTGHYKAVNLCRAAPDQLGYNLEFWATFKRKNAPKPKSVLVKYKVLDSATGGVITSGKATLKANNGYRKQSSRIVITAEQQVTYDLTLSYKSPFTGKTLKTHNQFPDQAPTVAQMDAANPPLPACA